MDHGLFPGILEALSHPEYTRILGWHLAGTMIVGAMLNSDGRRLVTWTIAIIVSTIFVEQARYFYWFAHNQVNLAIQGSALTMVGTIINLIGLASGWFISYVAKRRARHEKLFPKRSTTDGTVSIRTDRLSD